MNHTENNGSGVASQMAAMQEEAQARLERARDQLTNFNETALAFIKERPGVCLLGALAAGFIVGRIVSRR